MKKISIIGDSISTYEGMNPPGYKVYYSVSSRLNFGIYSVDDTWWGKTVKLLGGKLCVNASYSGGRVAGSEFPAACCERRVSDLRGTEGDPDVIIAYIGTNDFGFSVPLRGEDETCFDFAYDLMLTRMEKTFPKAKVICLTLPKPTNLDGSYKLPKNALGLDMDEYSKVILDTCERHNITVLDMSLGGFRFMTGGDIHPGSTGHRNIADQVEICLREQGIV